MIIFKVKRVPLNFSCPPNTSWRGYAPSICDLRKIPELVSKIPELSEFYSDDDYCFQCLNKYKHCENLASYCIYRNPDNIKIWKHDPPKGDGFQVWTDYVKGPISPVFSTFGEICEWMERNAWQHTERKATKEEWAKILVLDNNI